jgi:hypothetical protein
VIPEVRRQTGPHYYVDSNGGSDEADGRTAETAWQTLDRLGQVRLMPGDNVNIKRGSEFAGGLVISDAGSEDAPIYWQSYGEGAAPVFENDEGMWKDAIVVAGSWVVVQGFHARNASQGGVRVDKVAEHVLIQSVEASNVGIGFLLDGDNVSVQHCDAHDLRMIVNTEGGDDDFGAVGFWSYGSHNEFAYSRCARCVAPSYDYGTDGGFAEVFGDTTDNYLHHNWAEDTDGFVEVGGGTTANLRVEQNVSITRGGFACLHDGRNSDVVQNVTIDNNTIIVTKNPSTPWAPTAFGCFERDDGASKIVARNNVIWVAGGHPAEDFAFTHSHNLIHLTDGGSVKPSFTLSEGDVLADPLFVNAAEGDFALLPGSPGIDSAVDLTFGVDVLGRSMPVGAGPDRGAIEVQAQ